jgi:hypothetical protein
MAASYITPNQQGVVNYVTSNPVWILIHDGHKVIDFRESTTGRLLTKQKVYVADTQAEGQAEIDLLKLTPKSEKSLPNKPK